MKNLLKNWSLVYAGPLSVAKDSNFQFLSSYYPHEIFRFVGVDTRIYSHKLAYQEIICLDKILFKLKDKLTSAQYCWFLARRLLLEERVFDNTSQKYTQLYYEILAEHKDSFKTGNLIANAIEIAEIIDATLGGLTAKGVWREVFLHDNSSWLSYNRYKYQVNIGMCIDEDKDIIDKAIRFYTHRYEKENEISSSELIKLVHYLQSKTTYSAFFIEEIMLAKSFLERKARGLPFRIFSQKPIYAMQLAEYKSVIGPLKSWNLDFGILFAPYKNGKRDKRSYSPLRTYSYNYTTNEDKIYKIVKSLKSIRARKLSRYLRQNGIVLTNTIFYEEEVLDAFLLFKKKKHSASALIMIPKVESMIRMLLLYANESIFETNRQSNFRILSYSQGGMLTGFAKSDLLLYISKILVEEGHSFNLRNDLLHAFLPEREVTPEMAALIFHCYILLCNTEVINKKLKLRY